MSIPVNMLPWIWAVAAVIIALLELFAPGSYLIWIACAAAITAIAAFMGLSLSAQLTVFVIACLGTCVVGYYVYRRFSGALWLSDSVNRRDLDLVGAAGVATESFVSGQGKVRLGDTLWLAESSEDVQTGAPVEVVSVRGTTVIVRVKRG